MYPTTPFRGAICLQSYASFHCEKSMAVVLMKFHSGHHQHTNDTSRQPPRRRRPGCLPTLRLISHQSQARIQALEPRRQRHPQTPENVVPQIVLAHLSQRWLLHPRPSRRRGPSRLSQHQRQQRRRKAGPTHHGPRRKSKSCSRCEVRTRVGVRLQR
jgi:hypothetical protein